MSIWDVSHIPAAGVYYLYNDSYTACNGSYSAVGSKASSSDPLCRWERLNIGVITANGSNYCVQTQGGSTRQASTPQHHTDENSWWECVHNTQRLLRITPSPNTFALSPNSEWQKSFNMGSWSVQEGEKREMRLFKCAHNDRMSLGCWTSPACILLVKHTVYSFRNMLCCVTNWIKMATGQITATDY